MAHGDVNINVGGMYLEIARVMADARIQINATETGLKGPNDLPNITKANIHFAYASTAIIMAIASLEAHVNGIARNIIEGKYDDIEQVRFGSEKELMRVRKLLQKFKEKYRNEEDLEKFYRYTKLTKKVNLLFEAFGKDRICDSSDEDERLIWESLVQLVDVRDNLVHPKGQVLEDNDLFGLIKKERSEILELVNIIAHILAIMSEDLPVIIDSLVENVILDKALLSYVNHPIGEHVMLTGSLYTPENVKKYGTR